MIRKILAAVLRFLHREGMLLKLADHFDPPADVVVNAEVRNEPTAN